MYIKANYHTHTYRCMHAQGKDEEYVLAAIKAGIKVLGFADHEEISEFEWYNNGNGGIEYVKGYISSLKELKDKYKDQIEIHIGLEALYLPGCEEHYKHLKEIGIEYFILGQHDVFVPTGQRHYILGDEVLEEEMTQYTDFICQGLDTGLFSYVAHPDLFICWTTNITPHVLEQFRRICIKAKETNTPLEINVGGWFRDSQRTYPSEEFFSIAGEIGNTVIIGLDAHNPCFIFNPDERIDKAYELVKKYNLKLIEFLEIS